jgi:hypothetical protein
MLAITPNLRSSADHDGAVILDISHNAMATLNSTGAYIWQRLERGLPVEAIIDELVRETGIDSALIANDVHLFVEELKSKRLVIGC